MKVTTLDPIDFAEACLQLEGITRVFSPDLIVGIATGGEIVARAMYAELQHVAVLARRPSTALKERCGVVWMLVRRMPLWMRNAMRVVEAKIFNNRKSSLAPIELDDALCKTIASYQRILIVDDAIDSGATMVRVVEAVRRIVPEAQIATAVINVTTKSHLVEPDYRLYADRRLVRFPWSKDFCEK